MRRLLLLLAGLITLTSATMAAAADGPATAPAGAPAPVGLFVELVVNGQDTGTLTEVVQRDAALLIDAAALRQTGVAIVADGPIDVTARTDFRAQYDAATQRIMLDVPPALLPLTRIGGRPADDAPVAVDAGALLNYDLYVQNSGGQTTAALWSEQRVFGPLGAISNTGVVRAGGRGRHGYLRYDTSYRWTDERRMLTATVGDYITQALPWTGSVRMGGVQLTSSFRLRPDLITVPLPRFAGQASVPSAVDLFIDGYRQQRAEVTPGRFVLDDVPVVTGAGEARIVTTDAVGRQVATVIPFYVAADLLRPGLTDFSVEAGALRRGYGLSSFGYGRPVASASARRGISEHVTLEAHGEAAERLALAGAGAVWSPGTIGAVRGAAAFSHRGGRTGSQLTVGYSYSSRRFGIGVDHVQRSRDFADLASFDLSNWRGGMRSDRVSGSIVLRGFGSIGVGYIDSRLRDGARARLASASLSTSLGRRVSVFAAVDYDARRKTVSAQLRLIAPLGTRASASAGIDRRADGTLFGQASFGQQVSSAGGLGYGASAGVSQRGEVVGQANATWRARAFQAEAGAASAGGARSVWAGASGSISLLDGHLFAANALPGAFALVSTEMPAVPVYYENQRIGVTDRRGRLFVPNVTPFVRTHFAIDPTALPIGAAATAIDVRTALREGTGAIIRMPVRTSRQVTVRLIDAAGRPLDPGTAITASSGTATIVGWDGVVMIENASAAVTLAATTPGAGAPVCSAKITIAGNAALADLGAVRCE